MAKSFVMLLGRRYRVYPNTQTGFWFVSYREGSARRRVSLGVKTRPEAEDAVRKMVIPEATAKTSEPQRHTWPEFSMKYLSYKQAHGKAPGTVGRYKSALAAFGRYLNAERVEHTDAITLNVLEGYVPYRTQNEKRDPKTAYNDSLVIKNALKWGSQPSRGLLTANPSLDWETVEPVKPKRPTYTQAEVDKLEAHARPWLRPIVTTLAYTGMRVGELVALRWKDVDLKKHVIHIRVQDDWKPKGKTDRVIPMHPKVEAAIRKQPSGKYVFQGPREGRVKETYLLECLNKDQVKLDLPRNDLHGFRRFFATTMLKAGVSVETVRQWGGWRALETMLRYLADTTAEDSVKILQAALQRLEAS
ncbi:MAG: site-specific integrase [Planctomycetes bacterium]|nr:site-specific integrase [Planctomycetota bacterium]